MSAVQEPIRFAGYSISYKQGVDRKWHASVRMQPGLYNAMKQYYVDIAVHRSLEQMRVELGSCPGCQSTPITTVLPQNLR